MQTYLPENLPYLITNQTTVVSLRILRFICFTTKATFSCQLREIFTFPFTFFPFYISLICKSSELRLKQGKKFPYLDQPLLLILGKQNVT